ncbi:hypothetical protein [Aquabacter cavernae]|uniref:hypothetical protein n=1 Tax=Aquabacter cavernae TaxID=2496029 RepID=UPI00196B7D06|nr:hypothetical protein [Aquabacter cavernae]
MRPSLAQEIYIVPLSEPKDRTISVDLICQKDGRVGPFINISRLPPRAQRSAHIIASVNIVRNVDVFDGTDPNMIHFPATWSYADGPAGKPGLYVAVADLRAPETAPFVERMRSLTNDSQVYILQFLSSRFIGLQIEQERFLTQIDSAAVSNARIQECLKFAGFDTALSAVRAELKAPVQKAELKQLCLQTFGYNRALEEYAGLKHEAAAWVSGYVSYPFDARAECFGAAEKDKDRITTSFLKAAAQGLQLDYAGLAAAARAAEIPMATLLLLKKDWGAGDLPEVVDAERSREKADVERRLKYVYVLYARIKSCEEAFSDMPSRPYTREELDTYRGTMSQLSTQYAADFNADGLWDEASADYPAMLSKMRSSIWLDARLASEGCSRNGNTFEAFSSKLVSRAARPTKDF